MKVLVTGGAGYIGSHACVRLIESGYEVVVIDNLSNSSKQTIQRIETLTKTKITFYKTDIRNDVELEEIFKRHQFDVIYHFAGLKSAGESYSEPLMYYDVNVAGSLSVLQRAIKFEVKRFVFSSSAAVYGKSEQQPQTESAPLEPTSPYGLSKKTVELILGDTYRSNPKFCFIVLRYYNPVGANASGLIGENPQTIPTNLQPILGEVALSRKQFVEVYGNSYDTPDGTGIRDYIHIEDLIEGHIQALITHFDDSGLFTYNLGNGNGFSVLEMIDMYSSVSNKEIPFQIAEDRHGDIPVSIADPTKANTKLNWQAKRTLEDMLGDDWRWRKNNLE